MTTAKISQLTSSSGVSNTDLFLTVVSGAGGYVTRKATGLQLAQFASSSITSLNLSSLTASAISGNGSAITDITASNISNFTSDVRTQFSSGTGISLVSGQISLDSVPNSALANSSFTLGSTTISLGQTQTAVSGITELTASKINSTSIAANTGEFTSITGTLSGLATNVVTISTNTSVSSVNHFVLVDASGASKIITLPDASSVPNREYAFKKIDSTSNIVTISGSNGQTLDGDLFKQITTQYEAFMVVSNGSNWFVF